MYFWAQSLTYPRQCWPVILCESDLVSQEDSMHVSCVDWFPWNTDWSWTCDSDNSVWWGFKQTELMTKKAKFETDDCSFIWKVVEDRLGFRSLWFATGRQILRMSLHLSATGLATWSQAISVFIVLVHLFNTFNWYLCYPRRLLRRG